VAVVVLAVLVGLVAVGRQLTEGGDSAGSAGPRTLVVAPDGSDDRAPVAGDAPYRTLVAAVAAAAPQDRIVVRGGRYPITGTVVIDKPGLTIEAHAAETPVFDGSIPVTSAERGPGDTRRIPYRPMPALPGQGLTPWHLARARFADGTPTGLAGSRGWRCVTDSGDYTAPAPTGDDPTGCPAGTHATVITGYYPDQAWVDDRRLTQVLEERLVGPGRFYVARTSSTDANPPLGTLVLSGTDAADLSRVRVSGSSGSFLVVAAASVEISGLTVVRHSASWAHPVLTVSDGVSGTTLRGLTFRDNASIAVALSGSGTKAGGLVRATTIDGLDAQRSTWQGLVATYTDDTAVERARFLATDPEGEFAEAPQRGAVKATRNHRMRIVGSTFLANTHFGVWWDQSNYDVTLADSAFVDNGESGVFFEISHGLTMVNSLVAGVGAGPSVRLAGSSGVRLVNNTIVGGEDAVAVLTDARSRDYQPGRPCSEHPFRYGQPGDLARCSILYPSDLDRARPGAFGAPGEVNLTPSLSWRPVLDLMLNNVLADPRGSGSCAAAAALCVRGHTRWMGRLTQVEMDSILAPGTVLDGNVYQATGFLVLLRPAPGAAGEVSATTLDGLRGGLGDPYFGLDVERHGRAGPGWVTTDGRGTPQLADVQGEAAPVPDDPIINRYVAAGSRNYGWVPPPALGPSPAPASLP
jgi:hypothetical protein